MLSRCEVASWRYSIALLLFMFVYRSCSSLMSGGFFFFSWSFFSLYSWLKSSKTGAVSTAWLAATKRPLSTNISGTGSFFCAAMF